MIIPLGHGSHRDSSSLPEGCSQRWIAPSPREGALCSGDREAVDRLSALSEPGRLSPPIWPCTTRGFPCLRCCHRSGGLLPHLFTLAKLSEHFEDVSQVFLRDATVLLSAGGIFSVALSVNRGTDLSLCPSTPGVTRRVALFRHRLLRAYDDGVRTFLPPSHLAMTKPAITRLTRQFLLYSIVLLGTAMTAARYLSPSSFSNSDSVRMLTPSSFALSYFEPGSLPTTT